MRRQAAIVTVGSELVEGLRVDTNTAEIARALQARGFAVTEAVSVGDDEAFLATLRQRLVREADLVITTGGLGPTHDDVTRDATAAALGVTLVEDGRVVEFLEPFRARHRDSEAARQLMVQALVVPGAEVLMPTTGTAPGLVIDAGRATLALLPGPPSEMRPMLERALERYPTTRATPVEIGVTGMSESDAQLDAQRALADHPDTVLTVLARPGDVKVILFDDGCGAAALERARDDVAAALGDAVYSVAGASLAQATLDALVERSLTVAFAESCTGGLICAELTDVPGASQALLGGVVSYADAVKRDSLGVDPLLLTQHGAVSREVAAAMALGARERLGSDIAVSVTGVAGPDGGSEAKPVGLVWFGVASADGVETIERRFPSTSSRAAIRARSVALALDLARRCAVGIALPR